MVKGNRMVWNRNIRPALHNRDTGQFSHSLGGYQCVEQHWQQREDRQNRPVHSAHNHQRKQQRQNGDAAAGQKVDADKNRDTDACLEDKLGDRDENTGSQFHVDGLLFHDTDTFQIFLFFFGSL